jgi:hypothetical protein
MTLAMMLRAAATCSAVFAGFAAPSIAAAQTAPGTWTMKAPLPAIRAEVAGVALGDKLHAVGGSV